MARLDLRRTRSEPERGIVRGWHTGAQLSASRHGETVAELAVGEAHSGVPMTPTIPAEWASATKPVTCGAPGPLWQQGLLDLDGHAGRDISRFAERPSRT